ncbi:MAG: ATP-binding protein [Candidatus Dormibacteraeota bacterium]|nr:ATP-binding protein [Candidatus Dormibacteraeota bacterium]
MAQLTSDPLPATLRGPERRIVAALASCVTEADVVQTLYAELRELFGYDIVNLQVLEREGWFHSVVVDHGLLQDVQRRELAWSHFASHYEIDRAVVEYTKPTTTHQHARGPGSQRRAQTLIFVPIHHQARVSGAVIYQLYARRALARRELAFLQRIHEHVGVIVANAWLNETTRSQAARLAALNAVARALSATHDEAGIVAALRKTLKPIMRVDRLELVQPVSDDRAAVVHATDQITRRVTLGLRSKRLRGAAKALSTGLAEHAAQRSGAHRSAIHVPVAEGDRVLAVISVLSHDPGAYEGSTVTFLEQVADQVAMALRNVRSYADIEASRSRLEVANAVGRRLVSALDRWSIMRTLREELSAHLTFDIFSLAIVSESVVGPVVDGYIYDSGFEQALEPVLLATAGPSRQVYESGRPMLIRDSPWARELEASRTAGSTRVYGPHAVLQVTRPGESPRVAARSMIWVPVRRGERVTALLTLQSYRRNAFDDWHVGLLEDVAALTSLALATASHFDEAQNERRRLETILRNSPVGILLEDAEGRTLYANPVIEDLYGVAAEDLIGRPADLLAEATEALTTGAPDSFDGAPVELRVGERVVRVRRVPVPGSDGQPASVLSLHEDVTEERELMDAKDLMLRAIGHEVRSPAAAMRSTIAGLVQWGDVMEAGQRRELVGSAYEQSERLLSLAENQLLIAKLETSDFLPSPAPVSVSRTMEQVMTVLRSRYGERVDIIAAHVRGRLPEAFCEPTHLDQVLTNLIGNALEHTDSTRIEVRARVVGGWLEIAVEDDGPGLPADRVAVVFNRSVAAGHRARGGLGLGLYLCRLMVERSLGGRIWVEGTRRRGATFKFTVPAAVSRTEPSVAQ